MSNGIHRPHHTENHPKRPGLVGILYVSMHHTLEKHRLFPLIAWGLIILFALFVGHLTMTVSAQITEIEERAAERKPTL